MFSSTCSVLSAGLQSSNIPKSHLISKWISDMEATPYDSRLTKKRLRTKVKRNKVERERKVRIRLEARRG
jgi:hypothetical protein